MKHALLFIVILVSTMTFAAEPEAPSVNPFSIILSPIVWPFFGHYFDIQASGEFLYLKNQSVGFGGVYNSKDASDARIPGSANSHGIMLYHRTYFAFDDLKYRIFFMPGIEIGKANVINRQGIASEKNSDLIDLKLLAGIRNQFHSESLYYELGAGVYYRAQSVSAGNYIGYKAGLLPAFLFSLVYSI